MERHAGRGARPMVRWTLLLGMVLAGGCFELDPYVPCDRDNPCTAGDICNPDGECVRRPPGGEGEGEGGEGEGGEGEGGEGEEENECLECCAICASGEPQDVVPCATECLLELVGCDCREFLQ